MYISIPVILLIILIWVVDTSTQDEVNDFFGSAWNLSKMLLVAVAVIGLLVGVGAFVGEYHAEIFDAFEVVASIAIILGLIAFTIKHPKTAVKAFAICVSVLLVFNVGFHLIASNVSIAALTLVTVVAVAIVWSWVVCFKNISLKK